MLPPSSIEATLQYSLPPSMKSWVVSSGAIDRFCVAAENPTFVNEFEFEISTRYPLTIRLGSQEISVRPPLLTAFTPSGGGIVRVNGVASDQPLEPPPGKLARTCQRHTPVPKNVVGVKTVPRIVKSRFVPSAWSAWKE